MVEYIKANFFFFLLLSPDSPSLSHCLFVPLLYYPSKLFFICVCQPVSFISETIRSEMWKHQKLHRHTNFLGNHVLLYTIMFPLQVSLPLHLSWTSSQHQPQQRRQQQNPEKKKKKTEFPLFLHYITSNHKKESYIIDYL